MAKKKVRAKEPTQMSTQALHYNHHHQQQSIDDPSDSEKLKSLNDFLVKAIHHSRNEIDSLIQAKEAMEIDLEINMNEKDKLFGELCEANEEVLGLDLERDLVAIFVKTHLDEMNAEFCGLMGEKDEREREIGFLKDEVIGVIKNLEKGRDELWKVGCERDVIKVHFDALVEETSGLRGKVVEMEKNERMVLEEVENLKVQCEGLLVEKTKNEIAKGVLSKEMNSVKRMFDESVGVIEELKRKMNRMTKERMGVEEEKNGLEKKLEKLEREVVQLNESELIYEKEKKESAERILDLERRIEVAVEKDDAMRMKVDDLLTQLQNKERYIEMLTQQRDSLHLKLDSVQEESKGLLHKIEIFTQEKFDIEAAKVNAESIIDDLRRELSELKDSIASLTDLSNVEKAKNEEFVSEISRLGEALDRVAVERDDAQKCFSHEKKRVENLSLLLTDKEKKIEEAMDELGRMKIAQDDSLKIKEDMERHIGILVNERDSAERNLVEAQGKIDDMRAEMKSLVTNSEKALALLKNTSLVVCDNHEKGEVETLELKLTDEVQPFEEQFEAIKTSFVNKEKMVEEMKQLLEVARAKEREKKSFFTMVTAATTVLAAFSAVYVSRGR